ncbi:MAG TPA: phosphotransferase family protein [Acidimicrobiales bacterium]
MTAPAADDLAADLGTRLGGTVRGLRRLSGGASRETWAFDLVRGDGALDELILRRDPPAAPRGGMPREAALLRAAASAGVPVPEVVDADEASIVVRRIAGETIPRKILRDPDYRDARRSLASQCGAILARVHTLGPGVVPGLEQVDQVDQWRAMLDVLGHPHPAFELALRWLHGNRPATAPPTLVHGDFRNGNLVVGPDGVRAVLDWELAHAGDPIEDLGWLCAKPWRFGVSLPVGGFGSYDDLVQAYEAEGGRTVDRDALHWWEVLATLKWGIMCIIQTTAHTSGALRSVELAALGRRVCETEWDLLEMLPGA